MIEASQKEERAIFGFTAMNEPLMSGLSALVLGYRS
jgi:hypothetical protein